MTVAVSPNGRWLAAGVNSQNAAVVWDVTSGRLTRLPVNYPLHLAFSPDGGWLVTGSQGDYRFWGVDSWQEGLKFSRRRLESLPGPLAFSRDGRLLALVPSLQQVQLLNPATGRVLATLDSPDPRVIRALSFSPDGAFLAVATEHQAIQLWDLRYLQEELTRRGLGW